MKPFCRNFKFIVTVLLIFSIVSSSDIIAQTSITAIGTPITQNFNTLTPAGSWSNGSTLPVWYVLGNGSTPGSFILNDGNNVTANSLSSFGSTGTPGDRALGIVPGGSNGAISYYGWRLKNTMSSTTINSISITWTLEQWRVTSSGSQSLVIYYQISPSAIGSIVPANLSNSGLSQASPKTAGGGTAIDGNVAGNRVTATQTLNNLSIPPGYEILICWGNTKSSANHLMGVDDVSIVAKADQTITFDALPTKTYGDARFTINASASSELKVAFSSDNSNVATLSGDTITIHGPGQATITASQAGNSNYNAAPIQTQVFSVNPSIPTVKNATNISTTQFTANWTADNGLRDASTTYVVEYSTDKTFESWYDFYEPTQKTQTVSGLTPNTIYYYRVYSFNDPLYSLYSESTAITTGTDYVTVNTGNWDTGSNWDVGYINNIANSITVRHPITLNTARDSVVTNKLVIESTGKLTTNQKIFVTNELIIEVAADGTAGQILNTANIVVAKNAKITVRKTFTPGEWSFIGFPFNVNAADVHIANTETVLSWGDLNSGANYIVQQYDGSARASAGTANYTGEGLHWANVSPKVFTAKKGYIVYNNTSNVIDFTSTGSSIGTFFSRTGATVPTTRYASTNEHRDWNLIATPLSTKFNLGSTSPANSYYAYNGINYLPALAGETLNVQPFAAFFVQASSTSISFANAGRKVVAATRVEEKPVDDIKLVLSNGNSKYDDMTRIRLQDGASTSYEIGSDAVKMFGLNPNVSYLYSTINNAGFAINTLPTTVTEVDLSAKFAAAGNYTISLGDIENIQRYSAVILIDKQTGKRTDLLNVGSYNYSVQSAGTANRFKIQLSPKISTGISVSGDYTVRIISEQGIAKITGLTGLTPVKVFDATGKLVFSKFVNNEEPVRLTNTGLYVFEIATPERTEKIKTYIR